MSALLHVPQSPIHFQDPASMIPHLSVCDGLLLSNVNI